MVYNLHQHNHYQLTHYSNYCWCFDFTSLNILITDSQCSTLRIPYLTTVLDMYSQCCMGLLLSFNLPSYEELIQALRHAILPKRYDAEYNLHHEWRAYGIPTGLRINSSKFKNSSLLQDKLSQLGIKLYNHESASRFNDSFNEKLFHELDIYLASSLPARQVPTDNMSLLTLEVLEKILVLYFVDDFNQRIHNYSSNQTRQEQWKTGLSHTAQTIEENFIITLLS